MVGFKEDMKKQSIPKKAMVATPKSQSQMEQTRDMIITYILMGVKPSVIAKSMGLSRQYIYRYTNDSKILSYILPGQLTATAIARVLDIKESDVLDVMRKYEYYIEINHY